MDPTKIILFGAVVYVAILFGIGFYSSRKVGDTTDFIVAGRRLPILLCVFTVFATWFGSGTLIGAAGAAFNKGFPGVLANPIGSAVCLLLTGAFFARILWRMKLLTVPDLFLRRYGKTAEILCGVCIIPAYIGWVASILVAFGYVLHIVTGIDTTLAIVLSAVVALTYTIAGGMWAVTLTDFVQAMVIISGLVFLFIVVMGETSGLPGLKSSVPASYFTIFPENTFKDWLWFMQAILVIGVGNLASQDLLQRAFSARSEKVAQWSMYLATILYLTIALIPVLLGIAGSALLPELLNPEYVLPALGMKYLHPAGMALFVGAMIAALMSSAASGMLAPSSIFSQNILKNLKRNMSEKKLFTSVRYSVLVVGILGLIVGLYFKSVYALMVKSFSILFVGLIIPLIAAVYWKKANKPGAIASIVSGMVSWLILEAVQSAQRANLITTGIGYPADLIAAGIGLIALISVSLATQKSHPALPITDADGNELEYKGRLGILGFPLTKRQ